MAGDLNQCNFIGRLGKDPEVRYSPSGDACANFSIAVGQKWKDKNGETMERVEWIRCVAWRKLGEICGEYLKKGSQVYICGRMETRKWEDKEGNERYTTEIVVDRMQMLGGKRDDDGGREERRETRSTPKRESGVGGAADMSDDIPFMRPFSGGMWRCV